MNPEREIRELQEQLREARSERDTATDQVAKFKLRIWELTAELERRTEVVKNYASDNHPDMSWSTRETIENEGVERACVTILAEFEDKDV